ncbi:MAG: SecDF P1 head subdomain-containing protein, partial [Oscillospiraceae bacterium]
SLTLSESGKEKFAEATQRLANSGYISIWMDNTMISSPYVREAITDGQCVISGGGDGFTVDEAKALADKINGGALPFELKTENYSSISPSLGSGAK